MVDKPAAQNPQRACAAVGRSRRLCRLHGCVAALRRPALCRQRSGRIFVGASIMSSMGVVDDRWGSAAGCRWRPAVRRRHPHLQRRTGSHLWQLLTSPRFPPGVVGITNAMNLLDNMDGLSGGVATIAAVYFTPARRHEPATVPRRRWRLRSPGLAPAFWYIRTRPAFSWATPAACSSAFCWRLWRSNCAPVQQRHGHMDDPAVGDGSFFIFDTGLVFISGCAAAVRTRSPRRARITSAIGWPGSPAAAAQAVPTVISWQAPGSGGRSTQATLSEAIVSRISRRRHKALPLYLAARVPQWRHSRTRAII